MFNSGDMNETKKNKRRPKTKAFKDTLQKVTNASITQTVYCQCGLLISGQNKPLQTQSVNMNRKKF